MKFTAFVSAAVLAVSPSLIAHGTPVAQITPPAGYPAVGGKPVVVLVAPGTNPQRPFRQIPKPGTTEHMEMTMSMAMAMEIAGMQPPIPAMPSIVLGCDMVSGAVSPTGDVTVAITFTGAKTDGASAPPEFDAVLQKMNQDMKDMHGSVTINKAGDVIAQDFAFPPSANPMGGDPSTAFADSLKSMTPPWPDGMIGVGGRWEVRKTTSTGGMVLFEKSVYEITAIDDDSVSLRTTGEQTMPPQKIASAALPPGAELSMEGATGVISSTMTMRRDSIVPTSVATIKTTMHFVMSMNGESQPMNITMDVGMKIRKP
jgi:hypothetical protein